MELKEFGNVPFDLAALSSAYPSIESLANKARELVNKNEIIRLKRGVYVVSPKISGELLSEGLIANHLYGPSYVSMESALRHYGLIPEMIRMTMSVTIKHTRTFDNPTGRYRYIQTTPEYYSIGQRMEKSGQSTYLIATPEKALCDLLLTNPVSDLRFKHELYTFLEENLRLDMDWFHSMDKSIVQECIKTGKKKHILTNLYKLI